MDLLQLMEERYSLRAYDARPVEEEKLQRVLEAGRIAPTAKNMPLEGICGGKGERSGVAAFIDSLRF